MMGKLSQTTRKTVKQGNFIPGVVRDVAGEYATVQLSSNGAIYHMIHVVGGPVSIGQNVFVDYTTNPPTAVASGANLMDLLYGWLAGGGDGAKKFSVSKASAVSTNITITTGSSTTGSGLGGATIEYSTADTSLPPTDEELDAAFGDPDALGDGFLGLLNVRGEGYYFFICACDSTGWWYRQMVPAL